jgi:hypothetical protein
MGAREHKAKELENSIKELDRLGIGAVILTGAIIRDDDLVELGVFTAAQKQKDGDWYLAQGWEGSYGSADLAKWGPYTILTRGVKS